jgi:hypothetical protein
MKYNVLLIPCSTQIAIEQYNSLKFNKHFNLFGASHNKEDDIFKKDSFYSLKHETNDIRFIKEVENITCNKSIDIILPSHDEVLYKLKSSDNLQSLIPGSNTKSVDICRFKSKTYNTLLKNKTLSKYIPNFIFIKENDFFFKPDKGQGSRGSFKLNQDYVICEYLPGKEFTIDCFSDKNNNLVFYLTRERSIIKNGISEKTKIITNNKFLIEIENIAKEICLELNLIGAWFFQVKLDKYNNIKLLEVATRIGGASSISRLNGINLTLLTIYQHLNYNIEVLNQNIIKENIRKNPKYTFDFNTIILDYDDTYKYVIDKISTLNKRIIILTRNKENLNLKYKTIHINTETKKSDVINNLIINKKIEVPIIFIDDSFIERKDVYLNCNIFSISPEESQYL